MLWAQCGEWEENDIVITASWGTSESSPLSWKMFMFFPEKERLKGLRDFTVLKLKNTTLSSVIDSEATRKARHCVSGRWPGHGHRPLQRQCTKEGRCILLRGWTDKFAIELLSIGTLVSTKWITALLISTLPMNVILSKLSVMQQELTSLPLQRVFYLPYLVIWFWVKFTATWAKASHEKGFYDLIYLTWTKISVGWRKIKVFFLKEKINTQIKRETAEDIAFQRVKHVTLEKSRWKRSFTEDYVSGNEKFPS